MRLSRFLPFSRSRSPSWSFAPGSAIWRMLPTADGFLVGESRDQDKKQVRFFCVDLASGRALWQDASVDEDWWVGIEAVHDDVIFLHQFARPDMPEHAGIVALDRASGKVLWEKPHLQLRGIDGGQVYARDHRDSDAAAIRLDPRTGNERTDGPVVLPGEVPATVGFSDPEGVHYPHPVQQGDEGWTAFQSILGSRICIGTCEGVRVDDRWIFSYHATHRPAQDSTTFEHLLAVTDERGKPFYRDVVHAEAHMPVYDAFFVREGRLFYVRRERELVCVKVSQPGS